MARLNPDRSTIKTTNKEGAPAYKLPVKQRFIHGLLTSLWNEPKFYGDTSKQLAEDIIHMAQVDPAFTAKAAVYAREIMNLRTVPVVVLGHLATAPGDKAAFRAAMRRILTRPDQLRELVAYVNSLSDNNHLAARLKQLKLGLGEVLSRFDEYQLAKYNGGKGSVKLSDVLRLCHAKPKDEEQAALWKRLLEGTLATPKTWETQVSAEGNTAEVWDGLIAEGKLGYMATLRNLRNMLQAGAARLPEVFAVLSDPARVAKSKQFPYRFYAAYRELSGLPVGSPVHHAGAMRTVKTALEHAAKNVPILSGVTCIACDTSGSMTSPMSGKSKMKLIEVAALTSCIVYKRSTPAILLSYSNAARPAPVDPDSPILANAEAIMRHSEPHATNAHAVFQLLKAKSIRVDRVIFLSDMQAWDSSRHAFWGGSSAETVQRALTHYRKHVNPDVWVHSVDLAGYGTSSFAPDNRLAQYAGWSERLFEFIPQVESGGEGLMAAIEAIEL